ncbi:hypothetical protein PENFLA_c011G04665 [Penicillium flavigenum]|uniref:Uncharacterized protein n=1 Tax=Penicillium flavigenum TaxID=254877 RepID=A0A1V6TC09_9EURO|nr:hypothetical protein PENFLA_c011G04665 [Penicillium flavigenum]
MAHGASAAGAGRGGRSVRETRTCWYYFQVGYLKADCHVRQLIQCRRTGFNTQSRRHTPGRRAAAHRVTTAAPAATTGTASAAATKLRFPPGLLAQAHAILAEPHKNISRRNSI